MFESSQLVLLVKTQLFFQLLVLIITIMISVLLHRKLNNKLTIALVLVSSISALFSLSAAYVFKFVMAEDLDNNLWGGVYYLLNYSQIINELLWLCLLMLVVKSWVGGHKE